ncbi:NfeD family protein [Leptothermofonsia sp. ETS-13]|uniref:NfeD family protein n=1 Tax=Leptothermofonsia sp. ETS-13 TaxID=3035696 RepID=UPI003B9DCD9C
MAGNWCCAVPGRGEFANDLCGLRDGGSALMVAAIAHLIPFNLQVVFWMALSLALVLVSRRFVRQKAAKKLDAKKTGRHRSRNPYRNSHR